MRVLKKMSFDALMGNVSREEMKAALAGSGEEVFNGSGYTQSQGGGGDYNNYSNLMAITFQPISSFFVGALSTNMPGTDDTYVPQSYNSANGWGNVLAAIDGYNYKNNYSHVNNDSNSSSDNSGWVTAADGNLKTTDPLSIIRLMGLVNVNIMNDRDAGDGLNDFLQNETSAEGRAINDSIYGAIALNAVPVINTYHGPSTIPKGMVYIDGKLQMDMGVMMGSGGYLNNEIISFTNQQSTIDYLPLSTPNNDYIFSDNGSLIGMQNTGSGHNIKVSINDKLYNLSDLNTSPLLQGAGTASTITKIVSYLATKAGIPIGFVGIANDTDSSSSTLAFTRSDGTVYLNTNGGISKLLNNFDNLISVLKHEQLHQIEYKNNAKVDFETHANVYLKQCGDPTFASTTAEFKLGQVASLTNYLMNMDRNDPNNLYNRSTIVNKINEFNGLNNGYQISNDVPFSFNPGQLNLFIVDNLGTKYNPTPYTELKN